MHVLIVAISGKQTNDTEVTKNLKGREGYGDIREREEESLSQPVRLLALSQLHI